MAWKFFVDSYESVIDQNFKKQAVLAIGNVQSGKTKFMINETKKALEGDYDFVVIFGGTNNLLLNQSFYRFVNEINDASIIIHDIKNGVVNRVPENTKMLITSLKHQDSIQQIIKIIKNFPEKKFLIFDDESDFGGINIGDKEGSKIFLLLREVYDELKVGTFVSVTATPFADILSRDGYNFSQIIKLLPNNGYFGISEFNNSEKYFEITDDQAVRGGLDKRFLLDLTVDHIKRVIQSKQPYSQLLINTDLNQIEHEKFEKIFLDILELLDKTTYINTFFPKENREQAYELVSKLLNNVFTLNQNGSNWNEKEHSIIIGGALVSRGYTFNMLLTTLMLNVPQEKASCDTILQRARWFGYRKEIFNYMKIYMPKRAIEAYKESEVLNKVIFESKTKEDMIKVIENYEFKYINPTGKVKNETTVIRK